MQSIRPISSWPRFAATALLVALVGGCASPTEVDPEAAALGAVPEYDPIENTNRAIFAFNLALDRTLIKPVSQGYKAVVPAYGRDRVQDFLQNLGEPVRFFNGWLQADPERGMTALSRLLINSTLGIGGLWDIAASEFDKRSTREDLGQTLAVWGFSPGAYLMLPILGPSTIRDGIGRGGDLFLDPLTYVYTNTDTEFVGAGLSLLGGVDTRARNLDLLDDIERTSVDFYVTIRSLYLQSRRDLINNGEFSPSNPFHTERVIEERRVTQVR